MKSIKAKVKLELESKKVEAFEKSIEEAKQTRILK